MSDSQSLPVYFPETQAEQSEDKYRKQTIDLKTQQLFTQCWQAEHQATMKILALLKKLEQAQSEEKPTKRIENNLENWYQKQMQSCQPLITLIEQGILGEDAPGICHDLLGELRGYVEDCYYPLWEDHRPEQ